MSSPATPVFLAGFGNSEPEHWQSRWYARTGNGVWVTHESWTSPVRDDWVADLEATLVGIAGPKFLVAHSLGCTLVAEWATEHRNPDITGAFLVAPPDVRGENFPTEAVGFDGSEDVRLPFPALLVASENDPYSSLERSRELAGRWGARLANVGRRGHINTASGLGDWEEGRSLLDESFTR
ncbi:hypothetical protein SAMN04487905_10782 [Actinopolyspora xinjiangensis]|uniref:Alpha/beta hydrolase family protein n=1 Tax=Actinopolyspora xinjiangensis TaxID=405564 RepID=A0A1H0UQI6_9ACTN|nr:alpha/beta fold hydrolase [Actinopolyspora xinjiangensis]SDP68424.1 hypothetical protein SAMN04487905_10782 [Actinopolyspora xinjiangensis]